MTDNHQIMDDYHTAAAERGCAKGAVEPDVDECPTCDAWRVVRSDGRYYLRSDLDGAHFGGIEDAAIFTRARANDYMRALQDLFDTTGLPAAVDVEWVE